MQVFNMQPIHHYRRSKLIDFTITHTTFDSATSHPHRESIGILITARAFGILHRWLTTKLLSPFFAHAIEHFGMPGLDFESRFLRSPFEAASHRRTTFINLRAFPPEHPPLLITTNVFLENVKALEKRIKNHVRTLLQPKRPQKKPLLIDSGTAFGKVGVIFYF